MSVTDDRNDPRLADGQKNANGQHSIYLVLSEEERAKGFVRPVRRAYVHQGQRPKYPTRELTAEEHGRYDKYGYTLFEMYPPELEIGPGRYWTPAHLTGGCGGVTTMGQALAETYARKPSFYGATFCTYCDMHLPVTEFVWDGTDIVVGT